VARGRAFEMKHNRFRLKTGGVGALLLLCAAWSAQAQDNAIGPAQLKDFTLQGRTTQPARPQPEAAPPVVVAPPRVTPRPATTAPTRPQPQAETRPAQRDAAPPPTSAAPAPAPSSQPVGEPVPQLPEPVVPAPQGAPTSTVEESEGGFPWLYLLPIGALALLGLALLARRRRREEEGEFVPVVAPAPALAPLIGAREKAVRPEPVPRPWLELGLKAERATATLDATVVQFELEIANTGKAAASNLRIDVKMFNAGKEQDKEIGAFFKVAGRESSKCILPGMAAGTTGVIHAQVTMKRDDMRAVRLDEKLLFVPMIAVNALYDWGDGETGQTSKSYVVGRELEQQSEKMGAFRVDLGPRVWRTIGQRQHKLARQV